MLHDAVDRIGLSVVLVDAIEGVACGLRRQRWDIETFAGGRDGRDARCDAETNVAE